MNKKDFLNNLTQKLIDALPSNFKILKEDIEKSIHNVLQHTFNKLDLVTREEFDAQTKVLMRSRKKIESLEKKIIELEKIIAEK